MDSNGVPETDGTETKVSRRSVLRGTTAAGVGGAGLLAQTTLSGRARAGDGCNESLDSPYGSNYSDCDRNYWSAQTSGYWDWNCDKPNKAQYQAFRADYGVSWVDDDDGTSPYRFSSSSAAHTLKSKAKYREEACNNEATADMLHGMGAIDSVSVEIELKNASDGARLNIKNPDGRDPYVKGGGLTMQEWDDWVRSQEGYENDCNDLNEYFEQADFEDPEVSLWEQGAGLGLGAAGAALGSTWMVAMSAYVGMLNLVVEAFGSSCSKEQGENNQDAWYEWTCNSWAELGHAVQFEVTFDEDEEDGEVDLVVTQDFTVDDYNVPDSVNTKQKFCIAIPTDERESDGQQCDPYVKKTCGWDCSCT
jgi:hypothetical protein